MAQSETVSLSDLPEVQQHFITQLVEQGKFANTTAALVEALRLLQSAEKYHAYVDTALAEGLADIENGDVFDAENVFTELEETYHPPGTAARRM